MKNTAYNCVINGVICVIACQVEIDWLDTRRTKENRVV
jgi:hypothetical protein